MLGKTAALRRALEALRRVDSVPSFLLDVVKLLGRVARDPRVPARAKLFAGAAAVYAVSPLDLIPDVPVIGQLDDLWVVTRALRYLVQAAGAELVREMWDGSDESFAVVLLLAGAGE
jgi:uncharacterized membrane protein YkvA (DUF1232 family)